MGYQELSNGTLAFCNCTKIADIPFPFPFAQISTLLILAFSFFIPVYMCVFTDSYFAGPILTFLLFEGLWCVNEVSKQLENPFGLDVNDISLRYLHRRFMEALIEVAKAQDVHAEELTKKHEEARASQDIASFRRIDKGTTAKVPETIEE